MQGTIIQVSLGNGGVPKYPVFESEVTPLGLAADRHAHPQFHGGPRKAILIICSEVLDDLKSRGFPVFPGALGENLTTLGLDHRDIRIGQRFQAGTSLLEIMSVRVPCDTISVYGPIQREIYDARVKAGDPSSPRWGMSGFYASVIEPGRVRPNDIIQLVDQAV